MHDRAVSADLERQLKAVGAENRKLRKRVQVALGALGCAVVLFGYQNAIERKPDALDAILEAHRELHITAERLLEQRNVCWQALDGCMASYLDLIEKREAPIWYSSGSSILPLPSLLDP
jgi:hypothetical protein